MKPPYAIGPVPSLLGHTVAYRWRSLPRVRRHRASKPEGSYERVLPLQVTMDQLIFASPSHIHYWYEVDMLKVPAYVTIWEDDFDLTSSNFTKGAVEIDWHSLVMRRFVAAYSWGSLSFRERLSTRIIGVSGPL